SARDLIIPPVNSSLGPARFKNRDWLTGRDDAVQPQPRGGEQGRILGLGTLFPAGYDQHIDVDEFDRIRFIARGNDRLYHQHPSLWRHRVAAIAQDHNRPFVAPIVDNLFDHINIGAVWHRFEKASGHELGAREVASRARLAHPEAGWKVEEHAREVGVAREDC